MVGIMIGSFLGLHMFQGRAGAMLVSGSVFHWYIIPDPMWLILEFISIIEIMEV